MAVVSLSVEPFKQALLLAGADNTVASGAGLTGGFGGSGGLGLGVSPPQLNASRIIRQLMAMYRIFFIFLLNVE